MFQVEWLDDAIDELAAIWTRADSEKRRAITEASGALDRELRTNPQQQGESRGGGHRVRLRRRWAYSSESTRNSESCGSATSGLTGNGQINPVWWNYLALGATMLVGLASALGVRLHFRIATVSTRPADLDSGRACVVFIACFHDARCVE